MKLHKILALTISFSSISAFAADTFNQAVYGDVGTINELVFDTASVVITADTHDPGSDTVTGSAVTYIDIASNESGTTTKKITGQVDAAGAQSTLAANLNVPTGSGGSSQGLQTLSTSAADLVTAMGTNFTDANVHLSYQITVNDPTIPAGNFVDSYVVTMTVTNQ